MGNLIGFTNNYRDCSTDQGFQYEFICDSCGTGFMSKFEPSKIGMAGSFMRAAGGLFGGGMLGNAAGAGDEVRNALRGKARDESLRAAVVEAKKLFKQCGRCGKWVCPEACWNEKKNLCETCAPDLTEELASAQATAQRDQVWRKARAADLTEDINVKQNMNAEAIKHCTQCGAVAKGKFCGSCGAAIVTAANTNCVGCGTALEPGVKFCGDCGRKVGP